MKPVFANTQLSSRVKVIGLVQPFRFANNTLPVQFCCRLRVGGRVIWAASECEAEGESVCHTPESQRVGNPGITQAKVDVLSCKVSRFDQRFTHLDPFSPTLAITRISDAEIFKISIFFYYMYIYIFFHLSIIYSRCS